MHQHQYNTPGIFTKNQHLNSKTFKSEYKNWKIQCALLKVWTAINALKYTVTIVQEGDEDDVLQVGACVDHEAEPGQHGQTLRSNDHGS